MPLVNHKPSQTTKRRKVTLTQDTPKGSPATDPYILTIRDEVEKDSDSPAIEETRYQGNSHTPTDTYILTLSSDGQTYTLDALGASYNFNMTSAPWEQDPTRLSEQYKQISEHYDDNDETQQPEENGIGNEYAEDSHEDHDPDAPDPNNPYDWRHYIGKFPLAAPSSSALQSDSRAASTVGTPIMRAKTGASPAVTPRPHTSNGHLAVNSSSNLREKSPLSMPQRGGKEKEKEKPKPKPKPKSSSVLKKIKRAAPPRYTKPAELETSASSAEDDSSRPVPGRGSAGFGLGLGIDMGGHSRGATEPAQKKAKTSTGAQAHSTITAAASKAKAAPTQGPPRAENEKAKEPICRAKADTILEFDESAFEKNSSDEDDDDADDEIDIRANTDDDVEELKLPEPAVRRGSTVVSSAAGGLAVEKEKPVEENLRRQSTWDEDDEAMLQAEFEEALAESEREGTEGEEAVEVVGSGVGARKQDSDSESEEE